MKKNLIVLLLILAVVAVSGRYAQNRQAEKDLEKDLQAGLAALWESPEQNVQIQDGVAHISVTVAAEGNPSWNFQLARYIAARHPEVRLSQLDIRSGATPVAEVPATAQAQLETRKAQAVADVLLAPGQSLVLEDVQTETPGQDFSDYVVQGAQKRVERYHLNRKSPPLKQSGSNRAELIESRRIARPIPLTVRHFCIVTKVASADSDKRLLATLTEAMFIEAEKGETLRVVSWP